MKKSYTPSLLWMLPFLLAMLVSLQAASQCNTEGSTMANAIYMDEEELGCGYKILYEFYDTGCTGNEYGQPSDDIYYAITVTEPSLVAIYNCAEDLFGTHAYVFDHNGNLITSASLPADGLCLDFEPSALKVSLQPGGYYVAVEGDGTHEGSIGTSVTIIPNSMPVGGSFYTPINAGTLQVDGAAFTHTQTLTSTSCFVDLNWIGTRDIVYAFTLNAAANVKITGCGTAGGGNITLSDASAVIDGGLFENQSCNGPVQNLEKQLQPGTYYVIYSLNGNGSLTAKIKAEPITAPMGATLANAFDAGVFGSCNRSYWGHESNVPGNFFGNDFGQPSDDVYYKFELTEPATEVSISSCGSGFNTYLHVLNSNGAAIASNDDGGPLCAGQAASIRTQLPAGIYYAVVEGSGDASGGYSLFITVPRTFFPVGSTMSNAIDVGDLSCIGSYSDTKTVNNTTCFGNDYYQDGDDIFYKFTIDYNTEITISHCGFPGSTNFFLLNSSGAVIASQWQSGNAQCKQATVPVNGGATYYVVSEISASDATGDLTTTISFPFTPALGSNMANAKPLPDETQFCDYREIDKLDDTGQCLGNDYGQPSQDIYYSLNITTPSVVSLMACAEEGFNTYLYVLDNNGALVASKHFVRDEDPYCQARISDGLTVALPPGIFYIVVEGEGSTDGSIAFYATVTGSNMPAGATLEKPINLGTLTVDGSTVSDSQNIEDGSSCFTTGFGMTAGKDVFYKFSLAVPAEITASICGVESGVIQLLKEDGELMAHKDAYDHVCGAPEVSKLVWPLAPGTYYFLAEGMPDPYRLMTATLTAKIPDGSTMATAIEAGSFDGCGKREYNSIKNNTPGQFGNEYGQPSDDIFYRFTLTEATVVQIDHCQDSWQAWPRNTNTYLHLLNSAGELIESNDDNGPLCAGQHASIVRSLPAGVYFAVSEGAGNHAGGIITRIRTQRTYFPPGANMATAIDAGNLNCSITYTDTQNSSACFGNDYGSDTPDIFYKFRLSRHSTVAVSICGSMSNSGAFFLLKSDGSLIKVLDPYWLCGSSADEIHAVLTPGVYYVVSEYYTFAPGNMVMNLSILNPQPTNTVLTDADLNTIETRSFDTEGLSGHSKSYYDISGQLIQTQSRQLSVQGNGQIIASQSLSDRLGRTIGTPVSAPVSETVFVYKNNYIVNECGHNYSYKDFDELGNIRSPAPVGTTQAGTLGWYFSENNTWEDHVPVTDYPYSRIELYGDGTSDVKRSASLGNSHRMGQGHEALSGVFPVYSELDDYLTRRQSIGLPGNSIDNSLRNEGVQSVVRDENGKYAISITDKSGHALITARPGTPANFVWHVNNTVNANTDPLSPDYRPLIYFYILHDQPITITPTNASYTIQDIVKGETYTPTANGWEAGFYRIVLTSGAISFSYANYYLDVACQFYDDTGRLRYSVSPNGYKQWSPPTAFSAIDKSEYQYNHQGLMLTAKDADAGKARYVYRRDGKIRFSQNARQKHQNSFTYTHYDRSGRPEESGEYQGTASVFIPMDSVAFQGSTMAGQLEYVSQVQWTSARKDWIRTHYDFPAGTPIPHLPSQYVQRYVAGAVSWTENENITTWYSYDEEGRMVWMARKPALLSRTFLTTYQYDFSGNVLTVAHASYQGAALQNIFYHHYEYDADNRLRKCYTSTDGNNKKLRATYVYYLHGPLKRIELGDKVQGIDFIYNIQGWLTQINHPDITQDPGRDGTGASNVRADAFGMVLDYYESTMTDLLPMAGNTSTLNDPSKIHGLLQYANTPLKTSMPRSDHASKQQALLDNHEQIRRWYSERLQTRQHATK